MPGVLVLALTAAIVNVGAEPVHVLYPKNRQAWTMPVLRSLWNSHAHVLVLAPRHGPAFYWGAGQGAEAFSSQQAFVLLDGEAGTPMTEWDGNPASLDWVSYDVTALPYQIRKGGTVAVIGVGGGRDILAAIWSGSARRSPASRSTTTSSPCSTRYHRRFTRLADHPGVRLVHDEGRAFMTRTSRSLRRDPDVARRHLGGHRRRRLHAERERALHPGSVAHLPGSPDADRGAERVALVLAGSAPRKRAG